MCQFCCVYFFYGEKLNGNSMENAWLQSRKRFICCCFCCYLRCLCVHLDFIFIFPTQIMFSHFKRFYVSFYRLFRSVYRCAIIQFQTIKLSCFEMVRPLSQRRHNPFAYQKQINTMNQMISHDAFLFQSMSPSYLCLITMSMIKHIFYYCRALQRLIQFWLIQDVISS